MGLHSTKDSQLQSAIHTIISHYDLTSKSKKYSNLTPANSQRITKSVLGNKLKKASLLELVGKKDYYTQKVHKLLNESIQGPSRDSSIDSTEPGSSGDLSTRTSRTNTIQSDTRQGTLDPKYITNRYLAEKYIRTVVLTDQSKVNGLKELIEKHHQYQKKMKQQREIIIEKFNFEKNQLLSKRQSGLSKLNSTNELIDGKKLENLTALLNDELNKFNDLMIFELKKLSQDSENLLYNYQIPFFCINEHYKYPDLNDDKVYVLDLLGDLLDRKSTT
ncbi:hypothetical protein HYPBUDRAFT_161103 [Hyphopichia burtonii NRRL Y-1933]|uniref:Uncharacterized protein n=1 Tax=Hyphopichia burtonii NRRL Y-1933 TaxID=984485 RepID=A0A1E4RJT6_9ASCO|nr:hypothetical protein HYPBUDRAFT_161103 [Hyphopichia burtonii NRRL Y-1933]ODV67538.1 hypothetical protein HYPBUDRAFT_161103 [Hyphopichia burtonii NRRL Y-1933]